MIRLMLCAAFAAGASAQDCQDYCGSRGCGWTTEWRCPWSPYEGTKGVATKDGTIGYHCCCELRERDTDFCGGNYNGGNDCSYLSNKIRYVDVADIGPEGPIFIGKSNLPENLQGAFWLVNDGGDALISLGGPVGSDGSGQCASGRLQMEKAHPGKYCSKVSTVRKGGWSFQAITKP